MNDYSNDMVLNSSQNVLTGVSLEEFEQQYLVARVCDYYMIKDRTLDFIEGYKKAFASGDEGAKKCFEFLNIIYDSMVKPDIEYKIIERITKDNSSIWARLIGDNDFKLVSGIYYLNEYAKAKGVEPSELLGMYPRELIDAEYQKWLDENDIQERNVRR